MKRNCTDIMNYLIGRKKNSLNSSTPFSICAALDDVSLLIFHTSACGTTLNNKEYMKGTLCLRKRKFIILIRQWQCGGEKQQQVISIMPKC